MQTIIMQLEAKLEAAKILTEALEKSKEALKKGKLELEEIEEFLNEVVLNQKPREGRDSKPPLSNLSKIMKLTKKQTHDTFTRGRVDFTQQCPARYATGELSQCKKCKGHPGEHEFDETAFPGLWAEYVKLNPRKEQMIRATALRCRVCGS